MMITSLSYSLVISSVSSNPLISGSIISVITTCMLFDFKISMASSALEASKEVYPDRSINSLIGFLTLESSSTIKILVFIFWLFRSYFRFISDLTLSKNI